MNFVIVGGGRIHILRHNPHKQKMNGNTILNVFPHDLNSYYIQTYVLVKPGRRIQSRRSLHLRYSVSRSFVGLIKYIYMFFPMMMILILFPPKCCHIYNGCNFIRGIWTLVFNMLLFILRVVILSRFPYTYGTMSNRYVAYKRTKEYYTGTSHVHKPIYD